MIVDATGAGPVTVRLSRPAADHDLVEAVLEGGPPGIPAELRALRVAADEEKVKVRFSCGHEHFERVRTDTEVTPVIFRWTGQTRIAE